MNDYREKNEQLIRKWMDKWDMGKVQIWEYSASHRKLTIRITSDRRPGNLHIMCGDTVYLRGFTKWEKCHFQLDREYNEIGDIIYVVKDEEAGFLVQCGLVEVAENVKPVY